MNNNRFTLDDFAKIERTVSECFIELDNMKNLVSDNNLASELHAFYNTVGLEEGWLKPEYATPLSAQDEINKQKNINAAKSVVEYWNTEFEQLPQYVSRQFEEYDRRLMDTSHAYTFNEIAEQIKTNLIEKMTLCTSYKDNRTLDMLEKASSIQHDIWKEFVKTYQQERITPGNLKFREENYKQYLASYKDLSEEDKDKDRLIIAVITDSILTRADIGYHPKNEFQGRVSNILKK